MSAVMIAAIVTEEMTKKAIDNAPMQIPARQAKKIAKKPPAAAKDIKIDRMIALTVAAAKNSKKTSTPVKVRRVIVPTCNRRGKDQTYSQERRSLPCNKYNKKQNKTNVMEEAKSHSREGSQLINLLEEQQILSSLCTIRYKRRLQCLNSKSPLDGLSTPMRQNQEKENSRTRLKVYSPIPLKIQRIQNKIINLSPSTNYQD